VRGGGDEVSGEREGSGSGPALGAQIWPSRPPLGRVGREWDGFGRPGSRRTSKRWSESSPKLSGKIP